MNNLLPFKLGEITNNFNNLRIPLSMKQRESIAKVYRYYGAQGIVDYVDDYLFDGDYILVAEDGENLKSQKNNVCNYVNGKFWVNNHAHIINAKKGHDTRYLYYKLNLVNFRNYVTGSAQPKLTKDNLNSILLYIHEGEDQKRIGDILSALDTKIELNNQINAELEKMAKAIYDYWFVQFDFPDANGKPYKSSGGKMIWNEQLKREIPNEWLVKTIGEYAEVKKGDLITEKDAKKGDIKVVAAGIGFSYFHSEHNRDENTITISGSGANAGFINFWREPIFASDCITVRGKNDADTILILHHLKFIQNHILSQATGSAQPHVYPSDIKILNYAIPSDSLISEFSRLVIPMNKRIANNLKENQELVKIRDLLLPMLMNGQVKVL
jgi:type I restriction enzyme S subunit